MMKRREFITLLSGAVAVWPLAARAQQPGRLPTVGILGPTTPSAQPQWAIGFLPRLRELGWVEGRTVAIESRWAEGRSERFAEIAAEFVRLKVDTIVTSGAVAVLAAKAVTAGVAIIFVGAGDPVGNGLVASLARPGGNITGFANLEFSIAGKWADLLKQMAPSIARVALVFNPETSPQSKLFVSALEAAAPSLGVEGLAAPVYSTAAIEATLARLARAPNTGLIFPQGIFIRLRARLVVESVARYRLPAIYADEAYVAEGGLMHYYFDRSESYQLAPFYIDRILKGAKPGDLPIQLPKKFTFIVNRKTASALGIDVSLGLLLAADEVIE